MWPSQFRLPRNTLIPEHHLRRLSGREITVKSGHSGRVRAPFTIARPPHMQVRPLHSIRNGAGEILPVPGGVCLIAPLIGHDCAKGGGPC